MPLVRFEVRNEYRLGQPQLYKETDREDPKAVLDGVAVAGLVGILRQLGDLAEFAGEVFHGLQEQVTSTSSRSHKLLVRVQNIEAALPSLEKAVLAQTSHIHLAYTAGSEWRARVQNGQNHFIYNDLPRFIMDSYEECRDPPRLHLLDKFDTGGPGSCLRRYSDPTFFRRASGNFSEPDAEKVPKEKKTRKNKKKRSSHKNVDFLHSASIRNRSGRIAFSTPIDNGRKSSHATSTNGIAVKSDIGYHSNSFDSRTGSDYVESVFHSNSSVKPEEREPEEFSSGFMHFKNAAESVFSNEQPNDFAQTLSPELYAAPSSSYDTWDEKAEIVEPKGLDFGGSEVPSSSNDTWDEKAEIDLGGSKVQEMVTIDCDLGIQNEDIVKVENPDQMDFEFDFENMHRSSISRNDFDEVESETDNFMDALNTIESESEYDLDFQTKLELEQFSANVDDEQVECEVSNNRKIVSEIDSHILPDISFDKEVVRDLPDIPSENVVHEHNCPISKEISNSENSAGIESSKNPDDLDGSKRDSLVSESSSSGYTVTGDSTSPDALGSSKVESIISEPSSGYTGDALGGSKVESTISEPSSSLGEQNTISSSCKNENSQDGFSSIPPVSVWTNGGLLGLEPSKPPDFSTSRTASQDPSANPVDVPSPPNVRTFDEEQQRPGSIESVEAASTGSSPEIDKYSTQTFGLNHRLLVNGFRKKLSLVPDSKTEETKPSALTSEKILSETYGFKPSFNSLTSSPPLDHMKISFHPVDGLDASKLNLKFPDGNCSNGIVRDMFPSFQLVPEPGISVRDLGSDSDGDTFCRSSPYISDDCLSRCSDSDSEQWESNESPEIKDHDIYNQQAEEMTDSLLDLPSFDALNPALQGKPQKIVDQEDHMDLHCPKESKPPPPLPPPVQRRLTKSTSCVEEKKRNIISVHQQPKPATAVYQHVNEEAIAFRLKGKDQWKLNLQKEANMTTKDKGMGEKDDFLNQIRTKSFTLRRTVTAKANFSSGPAANHKVTAILEKAIAIRQAVGSDDGEDEDSWSDT